MMLSAASQRIEYRFKEPDKIESLAQTIAGHFPEPAAVTTAIYELLINAVEHGNLGIGFAKKTQLVREGKWEKEVAKRLKRLPYRMREASVTLEYNRQSCTLCVKDQGKGFNWRRYYARKRAPDLPNGRGLQIVLHSGFDEVVFNKSGNQVTCVKRIS